MALAAYSTALNPSLFDARHPPVLLPGLHGRIADDEDLRVARDRQVRPDDDPVGSIRRRPVGSVTVRANLESLTPDAPRTVRAGIGSSVSVGDASTRALVDRD